MAQILMAGRSKRGPFGQIAKWLFIGFNLFMAFALVAGLGSASRVVAGAGSQAEKAGAAIGTTLGAGVVVFLWAAGAVILGLLTFFTRGKPVFVSPGAGPNEASSPPTDGAARHHTASRAAENRIANGLAWVAAVFFILGAIGSFWQRTFISSVLLAVIGLAALPPLWRALSKSGVTAPVWTRWAGAIFAFAMFGVLNHQASAGPGSNMKGATTSSGVQSSANGTTTGAFKGDDVPVSAPGDEPTKWNVNEEKSKLDDSRNVVASIDADNTVRGWLTSETPSLVIRCKERKLMAYVDTNSQLTSRYEIDAGTRTSIAYRVGSEAARHVNAEESTDGTAFFIPNARALVRSLSRANSFIVEYTPFQSGIGSATFDVRGASAALIKVSAACQN